MDTVKSEPRESGPGGSRGDPEEPTLAAMARVSGHGMTIAVATGLFLLVGWWLDGKLGTRPLLTVTGALVGAGAGFYSLLQHMLFLPRKREEEERARRAQDERSRKERGP